MSRALRLLATSTALVVAATLVPLTAGSATAASTNTAATDTGRSPQPAPGAASGVVIRDTAVSSTAFVPVRQTAARTTWPVGGGRADLTQHTVTATGAAAQQLSSARLRFYRAHGGVMEAAVKLRAAPDASTPATLLLAFGKVNSTGTTCISAAGSNVALTSTDTDSQDNPVYRGSSIRVRPFRFPAAKSAAWNCAFVQSAADATFTPPLYDDLAGPSVLFRQTPILSIRVSNRRISSRSFTTVPIAIANSSDTVATATNTRLKVTATGLSYRFNPAVGTIKPGYQRKGSISLKYTSRYTGYFVITVRTGDYVKKVKYTVTPVR
ncbi:hypothetical protein [Nocardioides plantarum]|uniref:Uncharacterized protein n=1 Tax=Nocardioides plantarum TaxID=29299 RepID=A0ABV5K949_9ACTN|nr:hypothetical protein [Nocardioides plantarum]